MNGGMKGSMKNPIRELRGFLDVSQEQMADMMGFSQGQISSWESNSRGMLAETALKWWDKFKTPLGSLGFDLEDLLRVGR